MSRAAYVMDKLMQNFGMQGKSFIPLIIGFGCNVPGIMATRTLENRNDRLITILVNSFMSCSARLPVYVVFAGAFFPDNKGNIILSLYLLGIIIATIMAKIFKKYLFRGEGASFVMELSPYRLPSIKNIIFHMWGRGSVFIRKAGTIILAVSILIWVLVSLPVGVDYAGQDSIIGKIGGLISPILEPLGLGKWQISVSLLSGILAKEVVISTLGIVYGIGGAGGLSSVIVNNFTKLSAYSLMILTLLYTPCVATLAVVRRETNSWKWTTFVALYTFIIAWLMAFIVYQGGLLLGLG
jgi:ferrous iron transport protein B